MNNLPPANIDPVCSCGHLLSRHETKEETVYFNGLFNPALAGHVEHYVRMTCLGDEDDPCLTGEHSW